MESSGFNSDEETFARTCTRGEVPPLHAEGQSRGTRMQNQEDIREYVEIVKEIVAHQLGHEVYQAVVSILKAILFLLIFMLLCFVCGYDWIPKMLSVFMMFATGLRYCWLRWNGRSTSVINIPIG
ncbi:unnamed protein product [Orchesella dallaii]|uniref:Uncharacterized protein n=1 Tax=Orchesella dallaii TaxID=48710 RepID=A0ABP1RVT7_9HEXA